MHCPICNAKHLFTAWNQTRDPIVTNRYYCKKCHNSMSFSNLPGSGSEPAIAYGILIWYMKQFGLSYQARQTFLKLFLENYQDLFDGKFSEHGIRGARVKKLDKPPYLIENAKERKEARLNELR